MGTDKHLRADPDLLKGKPYVNPSKHKPHHIPQIKWECPPKFTMDPDWHVAAGEESTEAVAQSRRQILLEAVYPSHSAIPSRSLYVVDYHNDSNTPLIPSSPIKEEKEESLPTDIAAPFQTAASSKSDQPKDMLTSGDLSTPNFNPPESSKLPALEGDMMAVAVAGAAAALTAYAQRKDEGSLIDPDLLIQFLGKPETLAKLIIEHGAPASIGNKPASMLNEVTSLLPLPSSKLDQAVMSNINEHGVPAKTGVHMSTFSGPKAITPASFPSTRSEMEMMSLTHEHETLPRVATIPITSSPLLLHATTNEHGAPASTGPSIAFPNSKTELQMLKLSDENIQSPSVATTPRSPLFSLDVKRKDEGSLIDTNLLMLFLNNPEVVHKLTSELGASAFMRNEVKSSFPLPSSKFDQVMKFSTNEHGVCAKIGVPISEPKAMTPVSFSSTKPELKMKFKNTHEPPPRVATIPITSLPPFTRATTHEHGASSSTGPSRYFPSFKPEPDMIKLADENVQSSAVGTIPRSPLLSLPRATAINEHSSPANTVVPKTMTPANTVVPKTMTPASFPSSNPELGIAKLTDEHVSPPEVTMTPMSPVLSLPSATHNPILIKNLINDHRRHVHFESAQFVCSRPVAPLVPLPNPDPDVLKCKRLINEYGASDRTGIEPMHEKRLMTPSVPFSFPKKDISELLRGNQQPKADVLQSILHMRPLSTDVCPPPVIVGAASAPMLGTKLMTPPVLIPEPRIDTFILPMVNTQPTANVLQSALHAKTLTSAFVRSPPFVGATAPPLMHGSYANSQHGGTQGTLDYDLLSILGILNNQLGGPEPVQNMKSSASMPKHQNNLFGGPELLQNMNSSASMPKHQKPCMYFNGPRGCRNGSRCQYLHIMSDRPTPFGVKEPPPRAKRMRLDGETSGSM